MHLNAVIEAAGWWSYVVVFLLTATETSAFVGLLIPGETAVLLAAAVAAQGDLSAPLLASAAVMGAVTGDNLGYVLGRRCAGRPRRHGAGKLLSRRNNHSHSRNRRPVRARAFLTHHSGAAIFTGKFIGFARTFLPYAAGSSGVPYRRFFLYSAAASLVWGIGTVLLGYFAGAAAIELLHSAGLAVAAALAAAIVPALVVMRIRARRPRPTRSAVVASGGPRSWPQREAADNLTHSQER